MNKKTILEPYIYVQKKDIDEKANIINMINKAKKVKRVVCAVISNIEITVSADSNADEVYETWRTSPERMHRVFEKIVGNLYDESKAIRPAFKDVSPETLRKRFYPVED